MLLLSGLRRQEALGVDQCVDETVVRRRHIARTS